MGLGSDYMRWIFNFTGNDAQILTGNKSGILRWRVSTSEYNRDLAYLNMFYLILCTVTLHTSVQISLSTTTRGNSLFRCVRALKKLRAT